MSEKREIDPRDIPKLVLERVRVTGESIETALKTVLSRYDSLTPGYAPQFIAITPKVRAQIDAEFHTCRLYDYALRREVTHFKCFRESELEM